MKTCRAYYITLLTASLFIVSATAAFASESSLQDKQWRHGSDDCSSNSDPAIEIYSHSPTSFILRQSKCLSYEAPFMYLLIGEERALLLDSGATESAAEFPLYESVHSLIGDKDLLVVHSHGHRDHRSADSQFQNIEGVTLIDANKTVLIDTLSIGKWPEGLGAIDLGSRELVVIPTPGHQEEAISLYDPQTQWLLTGDTVYPGLIYVKHWNDYRDSIARLAEFAARHEISGVLGAHIEASRKRGEYYDIGTVYQPDEAPLAMNPGILAAIDAELREHPKARELELAELKVVPMNFMQRRLSDFGRWVSQ